MILGLSIQTFTQLHVIISIVGIISGLIAVWRMLQNRNASVWAAVFLVSTILTSVSGFPIPPFGIDPPRIIGVLSLVLLFAAVLGLYVFRLQGAWRLIYVVTAVASLYLNVFVFVVQAFQKIPQLNPLAPTQSEPPFVIAQGLALIGFIALGFFAARKFR